MAASESIRAEGPAPFSCSDDERFMRRAIELASRGAGWTNPNPLVGAVVVKGGRVIGEGWHARFGEKHAERNALEACEEPPEGATVYVTLEPCAHTGHQPPCADALVEAGVARVVVGSRDPNPLVSGRGNERLRAAGIRVDEDMLRAECDVLNTVFFHYIQTNRPYVVAKWAMTADGRIASRTGDARWVSGEASRADAHELRHRLAAIMVGVGTVLADDPLLTARRANGEPARQPLRIVCDTHLRIPEDCALVRSAASGEAGLLVAAGPAPADAFVREAQEGKAARLRAAGVRVERLPIGAPGCVSLLALMDMLGAEGVDSVLLEGGSALHAAAFDERIVRRVVVYVAPKVVGGVEAPGPVGGSGRALMADAFALGSPQVRLLGDDVRLEFDVAGRAVKAPASASASYAGQLAATAPSAAKGGA